MRLCTAAMALSAVLSILPAGAQSFVSLHGALKIQGNRIVDAQGQGVTLRGMALYWSQWKPAFYNADCVKWLRDDWKCTVVRASMAVTDGGYLTNPDAEMAKVRTVVQAAIDLGIYVIVDFHETKNGNDHLTAAKKFFGDLSKEFGKVPNIIYETWNEPDNTMAWATAIKPYHEAVIPVIRANSENIILCGTRNWSQNVDEAAANPITSSANIAYTLHFYATDHRESLRNVAQGALNKGIALMVTEGGLSEASGKGVIDTAQGRLWADFMDKNGIAWTNWSLADLEESSGALKVGASAKGGWNESQMNPSGIWVRNRLRYAAATVSLGEPSARKPARYLPSAGSLEAVRDANGRLRLRMGKNAYSNPPVIPFINSHPSSRASSPMRTE
ncbi:MAG: glycoside hydrolase family 5 protein [Fibrobacteria bacterium]